MNLKINTERQARFIKALIERNHLSRELQSIAGQLNIPELIAGLRRLGWQIKCERISMLDRNNQKCKPGIYLLSEEKKPAAKKILNSFVV